MRLTKNLQQQIITHAQDVYPNECCGLIIDEDYYPCDNVAVNPTEHFEIDPKDFARAESMGRYKPSFTVTQMAMPSRPRLTVCKWAYMG